MENARTWVTSDLHFGHDREFVWKARGYQSVEQMNCAQLQKFNSFVQEHDEVYILGDLTLGDLDAAKPYLTALHGHIHVILGNHDTKRRREFYESLGWDCQYATVIKHNKYSYYLSHYPTITANLEEERLSLATINLHGHTHATTNFYQDMPLCYHVGVDSHNGYPVLLDDIPEQIKVKIQECKEYLDLTE